MESEGFAGSNLMIENFRALISVSESLQLLSRQFAKSPIAAVGGVEEPFKIATSCHSPEWI